MVNCSDLKSIGKRIRELREGKGLTQEELSKGLNIQREKLAKMETGRQDFKTQDIINVADFFNVSCDYILRGVSAENLDVSKETGLSEKAINGLQLMSKLGYNWLFDTVNFIIEDSYAVINETLTALNITERIDKILNATEFIESGERALNIENGSHLLINLMYYLNTEVDKSSSAIEDEIYISKSGKLIDYNNVSSPNHIRKVEDIISIKTIKKSDIVNNILYEDLCDSIKKAKQIYQNQQKAGD